MPVVLPAMVLYRGRERSWSVEELAERVYVRPELAASGVEHLRTRGLVVSDSETPVRYQYRPASPQVDATVGLLAESYQQSRADVVGLVFSEIIERLRAFADAFKHSGQPASPHTKRRASPDRSTNRRRTSGVNSQWFAAPSLGRR
jgi:hypothetical protein